MSNHAAFRACYSDWKLIRTRSCVQIVFEVPLEQHDAAYKALGGMPNPASEVWCAVARLDVSKIDATAGVSGETAKPLPGLVSPSPKLSWHQMSPAQQAGILCEDENFHKYLRVTYSERWRLLNEGTEAERAALIVRSLCKVNSRRDIVEGTNAIKIWRAIVSDYRDWSHTPEDYAEAAE